MAKSDIPASVTAEAQRKKHGKLFGVFLFRIRSWEVVTVFFTLLFGSFTLTGLTDTESPLNALVATGVVGGLLWTWGLGLLVRWLVRRRNLVAVYERGMVIGNRKSGAIRHAFAWTDVNVVREHGHAAALHQGKQVMDASSRVWLTLKDGTKLAFINTLTNMEVFCSFIRDGVGGVQKASLFAVWESGDNLLVGKLLLNRKGLYTKGFWGTTTILWSQVVGYKCGTEALEFRVRNGKATRQIKVSWSKLPSLGALDMLIQHILADQQQLT